MSSQSIDTSRVINSIRVEWETKEIHSESSSIGKRKRRSVPTQVWMRASKEQRETILTVHTKHRQSFDTIEEAVTFSANGDNRFIQVRYEGNKNYTFVGRDGYLF